MKKRNVGSARRITKPVSKPISKVRNKPSLPAVDLGLTVDLTFNFSQKHPTRSDDIEIKGSKSFQNSDPKLYPRLFIHKLKECSKLCDFSRTDIDEKAKATKSELLRHLVASFALPAVQKILTAELMKQFYEMVATNLFRDLPRSPLWSLAGTHDIVLDTAWPHLSLVYSALQASFSCNFTNQMTPSFIYHLVGNTRSADDRERSAVLDTLTWLYQKCMQSRIHVRSALGQLFSDLTVNSELLSFYRTVIEGFNVPLKTEHITFFTLRLLPLHRAPASDDPAFWEAFRLCLFDLLSKSPSLLVNTVFYLLSHWPLADPPKEIAFLNELAFLFISFGPENLKPIENSQNSEHSQKTHNSRGSSLSCNSKPDKKVKQQTSRIEAARKMPMAVDKFFAQIGKCVDSPDSDVAQAAMDILLSPDLYDATIGSGDASPVFSNVLGGLAKASKTHWDEIVRDAAMTTMKIIRELDPEGFQESFLAMTQKNQGAPTQEKTKEVWAQISHMAKQNEVRIAPHAPPSSGTLSARRANPRPAIVSPPSTSSAAVNPSDPIRRSH